MQIKKGDKFTCIRDVWMNTLETKAYFVGKEYVSEIDGCITDEMGTKQHWWSDTETGVISSEFYEYFLSNGLSDEHIAKEAKRLTTELNELIKECRDDLTISVYQSLFDKSVSVTITKSIKL